MKVRKAANIINRYNQVQSQKKYRLRTVSQNLFTRGLKPTSWRQFQLHYISPQYKFNCVLSICLSLSVSIFFLFSFSFLLLFLSFSVPFLTILFIFSFVIYFNGLVSMF